MKTSIIILTCNGLDVLKQCIGSIRKHTPLDYELIVIDNGSGDGTREYLEEHKEIRTIYNPENLGFARGCNQGIEISEGENILLLNNDIIVTDGWLHNMLRLLCSDDKIGMVGPVSNYVAGYQQIYVPYKDISEIDDFAKQNCEKNSGCFRTVLRLIGFCLLVKRKVLDETGNFDEQFGLGNYEDDDLCYRVFLKGYSLKIALDSFVHHVGHVTFSKIGSDKLNELLTENRKKITDKWGMDVTSFLHTGKVPITISLCMIVKNEEKVLGRCLDSVTGIADEIIIVDTGSTDETKAIASKYTDKVYDFQWINDFSAARNFAFSKASMEYILWLDADDVIGDEDRKKLFVSKNAMDSSIDSLTMNYNLAFDSNGNVTFSLRRNRLVKRACHFKWIGAVHEYLAVYGNIVNSDIGVSHMSIEHESDRNLNIYEKRLEGGEEFCPRDLYYYANELLDHGQFKKAAEFYEKFLKTGQGWVEDNISACGKLADCYHNLEDKENGLKFAFKSFEYDTPRADFCCRIGFHFLSQGRYKEAAFWYKTATDLEKPSQSWGFINHDCWTWLPHLQLCVCYDRLGKYELACEQNELAAKYIPNDPKIEYNRKYFAGILKKNSDTEG